jgi:3-dehydroquinate synthase
VIAERTIDTLDALLPAAGLADASSFVVVADAACGPSIERVVRALERTKAPVHTIILKVEERLKSLDGLEALYDRLVADGCDRRAIIVALGGGVVGDLAGFAAATYLRGIRWIGVPTTLLAAVDSAIGGKTAINHTRGKNLIGAFHQPSLVVIDRTTFATLPPREIVSGYGEMLKYGLALDKRLWDDLIHIAPFAVGDAQIERCVARKAAIVSRDEHDLSGAREILNFGHTIAHAIEAVTDYGYYRHGEAVILGMRAATFLSAQRGHLAADDASEIDASLATIDIPRLPQLDTDALVAAVRRDKKKSAAGATRFILLARVGHTVTDDSVTEGAIRESLAFLERSCASPL